MPQTMSSISAPTGGKIPIRKIHSTNARNKLLLNRFTLFESLTIMAGIYIHIPFCKQACSYCDFFFSTNRQYIDPFVSSLVKEITSSQNTPFVATPVETLYLGGGTPSLKRKAAGSHFRSCTPHLCNRTERGDHRGQSR